MHHLWILFTKYKLRVIKAKLKASFREGKKGGAKLHLFTYVHGLNNERSKCQRNSVLVLETDHPPVLVSLSCKSMTRRVHNSCTHPLVKHTGWWHEINPSGKTIRKNRFISMSGRKRKQEKQKEPQTGKKEKVKMEKKERKKKAKWERERERERDREKTHTGHSLSLFFTTSL